MKNTSGRLDNYFKASSRSKTSLCSLTRIVVRAGKASVGTECAVTLAGYNKKKADYGIMILTSDAGYRATLTNPKPSKTASTMPAVNAEQLSELMSFGIDICRVICGSLSMSISGKVFVGKSTRKE